ncbi:hypothetical protein X271_00348 [Candidatus Hepatoplasma crinochetorum Av]|uniref:Uncharacterized protein n=2 Tax=Candidatus Hepatoplasma crinochetorum TaxID=295596 RepID=W8GFB2_9MOLU|nr:hypothetical protein X271_00348 [Candidatus Hepatoplasma crinochetorum Av]
MTIIRKNRFIYRLLMAILFTIGFSFWTIILFLPDDILNIGMNNLYWSWFSLNIIFFFERWFLIIPNEIVFNLDQKENEKKKRILRIEIPITIIATILLIFWFLIQISQNFNNPWIFQKGEIDYWPTLTFSTILIIKRWLIITDFKNNIYKIKIVWLVTNILLLIAFIFWTSQMIAYQLTNYDKLGAGIYPWSITTAFINLIDNFGIYYFNYNNLEK